MTSTDTELDDLVERLRKWASITACEDPFLAGAEDADKTLYGEAADTISRLERERDEAREAIRALWDEYMKDEACDYVRINELIELAYEISTPSPKESEG
jgi:hypothetical protein